MQTELLIETTVLPRHRIEVTDPELPEGACVHLIVTASPDQVRYRYPSRLEAEYNALIEKKMDRSLNQIQTELAQLRAEIEALPDA